MPSSLVTGERGEEILVVEFDDQGELFGDGERAYAMKRIEAWTAKGAKPLTLMVFIHGWHHNAAPGDGNLRSFTQIIGDIAQAYPERKVAGLYLGWRGECTTAIGAKYFSYWNRRNAAARVGGLAASHLLADIAVKVQGSDENFFVVIGHSFGGRVLETAITNSVAALCAADPDLSGPDPGHKHDRPLPIPDLVVLLNEASEALRAKGAIDIFKGAILPNGKNLPPRIVSITSEADTATRCALPFGQWFPARKLKFQDYQATGTPAEQKLGLKQNSLFLHSAGHLPPLWSHAVRDADPGLLKQPGVTPFNSLNRPKEPPDKVIVPLSGVYNEGTPYWVFQVGKGVMDDHNDIFNPHVRGLLTGIVDQWFQDIPKSKATPAKLKLLRRPRKP